MANKILQNHFYGVKRCNGNVTLNIYAKKLIKYAGFLHTKANFIKFAKNTKF